jgi:hypoxia up-regulated 1
MEKLTEHEDWLYEDGANANYTVYDEMKANLSSLYNNFDERKQEHLRRELVMETAKKALDGYEEKVEDLKDTKSWITEDERSQVLERIKEIRDWLDE